MKVLISLIVTLAVLVIWYRWETFNPSPHASYYSALVRENLDTLARRWLEEANASLQHPLAVALPYSERRLLESEHLQPVTFGFSLREDQLIQVDVIPSPNTQAEVFVDVFLLKAEDAAPAPIGSMATAKHQLRVSAQQDGYYLVRIHPSHTATGLIDIVVTSPYRYDFPVATAEKNTVQSFFGAARDGGRRRHEGIDIFAPRGTPVVAAEEGRVTRVGETPRGGKQVWVQGDGRSFYYAHLDSTAVTVGTKVARGDLLGEVGNTGNAINTPPHLHFGIYKRWQGAVDPLPLVGNSRERADYVPPEMLLAPRWLMAAAEKINLRAGPSQKHAVTDALFRGDLMKVDAISGDWLRITTGRGQSGFVDRSLTELPRESTLLLTDTHRVASRPQKAAPIIGEFEAGQQLEILGRFGDFLLVKMPGGVHGWALTPNAEPELQLSP